MEFFNGFKFDIKKGQEYKIISIDLGHGDTSAARMGTDGQIADMYVADENRVIHSVAGYDSNGKPYIGDPAEGQSEVYPYFKERPDLLDEYMSYEDINGEKKIEKRTRKSLLMDFLTVLSENIYRYNNFYIKREDSLILLAGCPSDPEWDRCKEDYAEIIRKATGIARVVIIPESKAAVINALESENEISVRDGIVVFDFGSLTSDCTYIIPEASFMENFSVPLGASMVEKNMLKEALAGKDKQVLHDIKHELLQLREIKESYYSKRGKKKTHVLECMNHDYIILDVDSRLMDNVTEKNYFMVNNISDSWKGHCRRFMEKAKENLNRNKASVKYVIVTGGASRMPFIMEICRDVFGKNMNIVHENNPQFSVSRGLCFAGYKDYQAMMVMEDVQKSIFSKVKEKLNHLSARLSGAVSLDIYDAARKAMEKWRDGEGTKTVRQLSESIEKKVKNKLTNDKLNKLMEPEVIKWLNSVHQIVTKEVDDSFSAVYNNRVSVEMYQITDKKWENILTILTDQKMVSELQIDFTAILKEIDISNLIEEVCCLIIGIVCCLVASALATIATPLRWIVNLMTDENTTWDDNFEDIFDAINFTTGGGNWDKELSFAQRQKVYEEFTGSDKYKEMIEKKVSPKIREALEKQYNDKEGFGIGKAVMDSLEEAISRISLQKI